ncbi:hypothetical protein IWY39_000030 [Sphingobium sp. JAI105]|uniref:hypothetical protein n=1 Tax=Sphingobium sp. JAI105 TaxID=2787715 RepID=UPI0018CB29A9|nr:hypothetical protein [Sphingobium sp. JAI105]MBG6116226.1 hypothetical protein [Sphingobium sp. JAI105]
MSLSSKTAVTVVGAAVSGVLSIFAGKIFDAWGVLDAPAKSIGEALKVNITGRQATAIAALVLGLILWGIMCWCIWMKPRKIENQETGFLNNSQRPSGEHYEQNNINGPNQMIIERRP